MQILIISVFALVIFGFLGWMTRPIWIAVARRLGLLGSAQRKLHGLAIEVKQLEVLQSGRVETQMNAVKNVLTEHPNNDYRSTERVTEYTIQMPAWLNPVWVADAESIELARLEARGEPHTGDATFDEGFSLLRPASPESAEVLSRPGVRKMLIEISHNIGCVRLEGGLLIFRDPGGATDLDVEITAELVAGLVDQA